MKFIDAWNIERVAMCDHNSTLCLYRLSNTIFPLKSCRYLIACILSCLNRRKITFYLTLSRNLCEPGGWKFMEGGSMNFQCSVNKLLRIAGLDNVLHGNNLCIDVNRMYVKSKIALA